MREYVFMSDVNNDLEASFAEAENVRIFPQYYHFNDGVVYGDEIVLNDEEFYAKLAKKRAYSQGCNPQRVHGIMEEALKEDKDIIAVMASSDCSGSYNTVLTEARELMAQYPGSRIHVVDDRMESAPGSLLIHMGIKMKKDGKSFDEVVETLEARKWDTNILFLVDHLDYLVRGGRLSPISGVIGTALNIKPILTMKDGLIVSLMKCRGKQAGKKAMLEYLKQFKLEEDYFAVGHTLNEAEAAEFGETCRKELGVNILFNFELNPTIGTHTGPGLIGVVFMKKPE